MNNLTNEICDDISALAQEGAVAPPITEDKNTYDRELTLEALRAEGWKIVVPADNELQIDIDCEEDEKLFLRNFSVLFDYLTEGNPSYVTTPSPSGEPFHSHITVTLPFAVTPWQRIALQASLGSDRMRELLSSVRVIHGHEPATIFKEKP